jgi:hypothetical protein
MIKSMLLRVIGQRNAGRLDYVFNRKSADAWGPLNGQRIRQGVYKEMISRINFQAIVETGTYRGTTTAYFAEYGSPVYTVEIHPRCFAYASLRFRKHDRVHVYEGNSPEFLRELARLPECPRSRVLFYLDAHVQDSSRYHKAPLVEELTIIFSQWRESVVMIDDFQVPGTSYSFDDWGPGRNLCLDCFEPLQHFGLRAFFPVADATNETGAKRGWVVVCRDRNIVQTLNGIAGLRQYPCTPSRPQ